MRKILSFLILTVMLLLASGLVAQQAPGDCYTYYNSSVYSFGSFSYNCAGTGGTCTECTYFHPGGHEVCHYSGPDDTYCVDYQDF